MTEFLSERVKKVVKDNTGIQNEIFPSYEIIFTFLMERLSMSSPKAQCFHQI